MTLRDERCGPFDDPDRYFCDELISAGGGEGSVRRGRHLVDGFPFEVAIKVLHDEHTPDLDVWATRWEAQRQLLNHLDAGALVKIVETFIGARVHQAGAGSMGRNLYLVMDWVEGPTLDVWFGHHADALPGERLAKLAPVAAVLDLLHSGAKTDDVPFVHRDVKPSNVIVNDRFGATLVDPGLLRTYRPADNYAPDTAGTPGYRAPEVLQEGRWSPASDRYAFGALGFLPSYWASAARAVRRRVLRHDSRRGAWCCGPSRLGGRGHGAGRRRSRHPAGVADRVAPLDPLEDDRDAEIGAVATASAHRCACLATSATAQGPAPCRARCRARGRCGWGGDRRRTTRRPRLPCRRWPDNDLHYSGRYNDGSRDRRRRRRRRRPKRRRPRLTPPRR